jgi:hypothetical protein
LTLGDNQESPCIRCRSATIISPPRLQITIVIVALISLRLSRNRLIAYLSLVPHSVPVRPPERAV